MMQIKIHESYRRLVALCDSELIGKKFLEGKKQLDVREDFFKGEEVSAEEAVRILRNQREDDATFNIVGKESVKAAFDSGIIMEDSTGEVQGIPFALVLL